MIGKTLSHYKILEQIGAGGMGVVYRAHDERLGRDVALKLLLADALGSESARRALENEARTASALNHPNICTIHDVGQAEGQFFVAMEYVEGKPLAQLIPAGGLPEEQVMRYGMQIADALTHAEHRGIVHRDLKSANVVVTPEGRAKVLDFGLAQRVRKEELEEVTRSKVSIEASRGIAGTLAYMAPETLRGETADARSDIWALGVVLHEMAAGELPFQGVTGFELSSAILREPPRALPARVPAGHRGVIQRCLVKDPAQRYQRAGEVKAALEAIGTGASTAHLAAAPALKKHAVVWRNAMFGSAGVLALAALLVAFNVGGLRERLLGHAGPPRIESLAVLPFENLSSDKEQDYFSDGMTDELIGQLQRLGGLKRVSPRSSVMRFKGSHKSLQEIAADLKVDALITGAVLKSGNRIRINVQLISPATEEQLWSFRDEREIRDVLILQNEVTRAIASEIRLKLTTEEQARLASKPPVKPEAYEAYRKGRYHWDKRTEEGTLKAVEQFEQAIKFEPGYALAYAGLANSYNIFPLYAAVAPKDAFPKAKAAATKALEIDATLAEAHTALAWAKLVYDWDWTEAKREFKQALELDPNYELAHFWYGLQLTWGGESDQGLAELKRAQELDPVSLNIGTFIGVNYYLSRQYDSAIVQLKIVRDLDRNVRFPHVWLGLTYVQKGLYQQGISEIDYDVKSSGQRSIALGRLGYAYAKSGQRKPSLAVLEQLNDLAKQKYVPAVDFAIVHLGLRENEQALSWLQKGYEERATEMLFIKVDPRFDPLRSDPRFQALLQRMNFPQ